MVKYHPNERCAKCESQTKIARFVWCFSKWDHLIIHCDTCGFNFKRKPMSDGDVGKIIEANKHG